MAVLSISRSAALMDQSEAYAVCRTSAPDSALTISDLMSAQSEKGQGGEEVVD